MRSEVKLSLFVSFDSAQRTDKLTGLPHGLSERGQALSERRYMLSERSRGLSSAGAALPGWKGGARKQARFYAHNAGIGSFTVPTKNSAFRLASAPALRRLATL